MKLINIGFGNLVSAGRVVAVVSPDSAPVSYTHLKEGKNREIRQMCEAVGLEVIRLKRNAEGVVKLGMPVSYTHLDVYKRQGMISPRLRSRASCASLRLTVGCFAILVVSLPMQPARRAFATGT